MVSAAVCTGVVDFAALGVDQAGEGRQTPGFAAVGYFAWAGYNGGDGWVFDKVDARALVDTLFIKAKNWSCWCVVVTASNESVLLAD